MNALLSQLGMKVRSLRLEKELSLRRLSEDSGLSVRFLSEIEGGNGNISVARLADLAAALGQPAWRLLVEAERTHPHPAFRVVSLLGLRGAGKSTIGASIAARLAIPFVELDELIEEEAGLSLGEIFDLHGEETYRRLELQILRRFLDADEAAILATGGGIVTHEESFRLLEERTLTVWLRADPDDHWNRVVAQGDARPMADNPGARAELRRILSEREPLYARAAARLDTTELGVEASVDELLRRLEDLPNRLP